MGGWGNEKMRGVEKSVLWAGTEAASFLNWTSSIAPSTIHTAPGDPGLMRARFVIAAAAAVAASCDVGQSRCLRVRYMLLS